MTTLSRAACFRVAGEARARGMRLVGHLPRAVELDETIAAGQSSFEHARLFVRHCTARAAAWRAGRLDAVNPILVSEAMVREHDPVRCARSFEAMRTSGAWFVPTHVTREEDARADDPGFVGDPRLAYLDPLSRRAYRDDLSATAARYPGERGRAALRRSFELALRLTGRAYRAGVPVLVGTDTVIGGLRYHDEMAHLVRAGLSPAEVLRAATIDAARYAGMDGRFGAVEVGSHADLVILDGDPLVDIANTRRIRAVLVDGRLYDRGRLDGLLKFVRGEAGGLANWAKLLWG